MRTLWLLTLGLVALTATQGCRRTEPQPIPGPKALAGVMGHARAPGIAWFQGGLDEAFTMTPRICSSAAPQSRAPSLPDLLRMRTRANSPSAATCRAAPCPPLAYP